MKNKVAKKAVTFALSAVIVCGAMAGITGCGTVGSTVKKQVDKSKTQIYLGVTQEGIDSAWLSPVIERFEKDYPQYQVFVDGITNEMVSTLPDTIPTSRDDLYFLQDLPNMASLAKQGIIDDITDVVTTGDTAFENGMTIESKIMSDYIDAYRTQSSDGSYKYYGIPYVLVTYGIIYDAELFRTKNLYNLKNYKGLDAVEGTADDNFGPDGKENTYDDGLPATWEDFKVMMNEMVKRGVTPFVWSGEHSFYRQNLVHCLLASYEGAEQHRIYFDLEGYDEMLQKEITPENGWELSRRPSQKAALTAVHDIVSNSKYYSNKAFFVSTSHLGAQNEFILSTKTNTPIAMLVEGGWWENEAKGTFKEMERYGSQYGYGKRDFRMMPLPKFIGTEGVVDQLNMNTTLYSDYGESIVCLNSASKKKDAAKLFLRYVHMDENLKAFTSDNGMSRPLNYEFTETEFASLSKYAQDVWKIVHDEKTEIVSSVITNPIPLANSAHVRNLRCTGILGTTGYAEVFGNFFQDSSLTVDKYLQAIANKYNETTWKNDIKLS